MAQLCKRAGAAAFLFLLNPPAVGQPGAPSDALPQRGQVTYTGTWELDVLEVGRRRSRSERREGTVEFLIILDNGKLRGGSTERQGVPLEFGGTLSGGICRLVHDRNGQVLEGPCDRRRFQATITDPPTRGITTTRSAKGRLTATAQRVLTFDSEGRITGPKFVPAVRASSDSGPPGMLFYVNDEHRSSVPMTYLKFDPAPAAARAMQSAAQGAIEADSQSWMLNRLKPGTFSQPQFFRSPTDPADVYLRLVYEYLEGDGWGKIGWAELRFRGGALECVLYHDRRTCSRPRPGRGSQIAALGDGKRRLGPITVSPGCFRTRTRSVTKPVQIVIDHDRNGAPVTRTEYRAEQVEETIFQCADVSIELSCVAEGSDRLIEWMVGTGSTRSRNFALRRGAVVELNPQRIAELNQRIGRGTCVRTK